MLVKFNLMLVKFMHLESFFFYLFTLLFLPSQSKNTRGNIKSFPSCFAINFP